MKILFVCLGNICRSPTAEAVFRAVAAREAPELMIEVDSAGTAGYHIGEPPDLRTRQAAIRRGYDMSPLRARILEPRDFEDFDHQLGRFTCRNGPEDGFRGRRAANVSEADEEDLHSPILRCIRVLRGKRPWRGCKRREHSHSAQRAHHRPTASGRSLTAGSPTCDIRTCR